MLIALCRSSLQKPAAADLPHTQREVEQRIPSSDYARRLEPTILPPGQQVLLSVSPNKVEATEASVTEHSVKENMTHVSQQDNAMQNHIDGVRAKIATYKKERTKVLALLVASMLMVSLLKTGSDSTANPIHGC